MQLGFVSSCTIALSMLAPPVLAQGRFANFETPQTHPIEIAQVGETEYLLVCNTPDNSVEIYEAAAPHAFVQRVPVGMGPASVRWNPGHGRFYTCNFDGDSVSIVRLDPIVGGVTAVLERTDSVGDEPSDIAFHPNNATAAVSLSTRSAVALVDALDLSFGSLERLTVTHPVTAEALAVKMPRAVAWLPGNRFFAANLRGGSPDPADPIGAYDVGLYRFDPSAPITRGFASGLGSTNHAFAIDSDGALLFLVGTKAQNHSAVGVDAVSQLETGFVQSWLMVVDIPTGSAMTVRPEAPPAVLPAPTLQSINLNRDYSSPALAPVPTEEALVQPTDVLLIEDKDGDVERIVVTGFHSDRVALLVPDPAVAGGYAIKHVDIPVLTPGDGYSVVGPRGLAYSAKQKRVYVNGRLDNTVAVVDPVGGNVTAHFQLQNDPTPPVIREGRQFLYSNRFSIDDSNSQQHTGGFVSCAVCHVDARNDGVPWDLGVTVAGPEVPPEFHDGNDQDTTSMPLFPSEKGPMMTQTLQGLVNYLLNEEFQNVATNAPYHWRGDKVDFTDFNEAFVNLQGMDSVSGDPDDPKGISDEEMIQYRRFINTVLHPPNPEQDALRITPGTLGSDPNDPTQATGAKLGLMLFHDFPFADIRSCVDCHHLPDGSTNTSTLTFFVPRTISGPPGQTHPMETAALRNVGSREAAIHDDFTDDIVLVTANNGLAHPGDQGFIFSTSLNTFIHGNFEGRMPGPSQQDITQQTLAMTEFVRQFDTGTAPLAGLAYTIDPTLDPIDSGPNAQMLDQLEGQVDEANIGLAAYTRDQGVVRGYWYDITASPPVYVEEGTNNILTRAQLLALAPGTDDVVILQGTPLGVERRWASTAGTATELTGPRPANITLEPMAPNTAYVDVSLFNLQLGLSQPPDTSIWTLRTLQQSVLGLFGVPGSRRHEPPRRFRVTADNVLPGARILLGVPAGDGPAELPVEPMVMNLYPTRYTSNGRQVWETRVELDATQTFALLNGGYWAPDVNEVLLRQTSTPDLQPAAWNFFLAGVRNEDGKLGYDLTAWQPLTIQDGR